MNNLEMMNRWIPFSEAPPNMVIQFSIMDSDVYYYKDSDHSIICLNNGEHFEVRLYHEVMIVDCPEEFREALKR